MAVSQTKISILNSTGGGDAKDRLRFNKLSNQAYIINVMGKQIMTLTQ